MGVVIKFIPEGEGALNSPYVAWLLGESVVEADGEIEVLAISRDHRRLPFIKPVSLDLHDPSSRSLYSSCV